MSEYIGKRYKNKFGGYYRVVREYQKDLQTFLDLQREDDKDDIRVEIMQSLSFENTYKLVDENGNELIDKCNRLYYANSGEQAISNRINELRHKQDEIIDEVNIIKSLDLVILNTRLIDEIRQIKSCSSRTYDLWKKQKEKLETELKNEKQLRRKLQDEVKELKKALGTESVGE